MHFGVSIKRISSELGQIPFFTITVFVNVLLAIQKSNNAVSVKLSLFTNPVEFIIMAQTRR